MKPLNRRAFLARSTIAVGGAAGVTAGLASAERARAALVPLTAEDASNDAGAAASATDLSTSRPFAGVHQEGVLTPKPAHASLVALDSFAPDRATLAQALKALSGRAQELTAGGPIPLLEVDAPPADSGILGPVNAPDALTITIGFGASLFDGRYGLASQRPAELIPMPSFPVDQLDPTLTHGDLLIQICAQHRDTVVHALRELLRTVRGTLQQRWAIDGFEGAGRGPTKQSNPRNLFAFRDGTANPPADDAALMNQLTWVGGGDQRWAVGGTYQVVRIIRMHVEFWDRVALREQENMIGRSRDTGAPLGGTNEFEDPRFDLDPNGKRIPLTAHMRLANPRTPATANQRMIRRGFNYHRGFDKAGQLDQGLVFIAFNQAPSRQFVPVQTRLNQEPMIDYITPIGGGYFFVPPGAQSQGDWVGSGLFLT
ncbi:MAG TPA: Dyp-type peroxidase [Solirubrobacteraceae bacterium]|nr:Dyp-type peroxidase [Solirubrobacteraceae bacterium]